MGKNVFLHSLRSEAGVILSSHAEIRTELVGFMRTCTRMSWEQDGILKVFFFKGLTQCQTVPMQSSQEH